MSAAGGEASQGHAELVTLAIKAAVALRKAVPDPAGLGGGGEAASAIAAALEAAGRLMGAAPHLKSCAGAFPAPAASYFAVRCKKAKSKRFRCRDSNPGRPGESRIS